MSRRRSKPLIDAEFGKFKGRHLHSIPCKKRGEWELDRLHSRSLSSKISLSRRELEVRDLRDRRLEFKTRSAEKLPRVSRRGSCGGQPAHLISAKPLLVFPPSSISPSSPFLLFFSLPRQLAMSRRDSSRVHVAVRQSDSLAEFENCAWLSSISANYGG